MSMNQLKGRPPNSRESPNITHHLLENVLTNEASSFERCSPRYHLSTSPDWYRRDITPRNPLHLLTPFLIQSASAAPTPQILLPSGSTQSSDTAAYRPQIPPGWETIPEAFTSHQLVKNCSNFQVDEKQTHQKLAARCIQLMSESLKQDICGLDAPGALVVNMDSSRVERSLPTELQYACLYWIQHLQKSGALLYDNDQVYQFLQVHLLHWLEAHVRL